MPSPHEPSHRVVGRYFEGKFRAFPFVVPILADENQFGYARCCYRCGVWKKVRYFLHVSGHIYPLCGACGDTMLEMQDLGKIVNG